MPVHCVVLLAMHVSGVNVCAELDVEGWIAELNALPTVSDPGPFPNEEQVERRNAGILAREPKFLEICDRISASRWYQHNIGIPLVRLSKLDTKGIRRLKKNNPVMHDAYIV